MATAADLPLYFHLHLTGYDHEIEMRKASAVAAEP